MNARRLIVAFVILAAAAQLHAAEFERASQAIERETSLEREWIPFFGVARTFIRAIAPNGVQDVQLAVYNGENKAEWNDLVRAVTASAGGSFRPMVSARERSGESTLVLARPRGKYIELMILNRDDEDTVLVRVVCDPKEAESIAFDHDFR